jgi:hypothetical protein
MRLPFKPLRNVPGCVIQNDSRHLACPLIKNAVNQSYHSINLETGALSPVDISNIQNIDGIDPIFLSDPSTGLPVVRYWHLTKFVFVTQNWTEEREIRVDVPMGVHYAEISRDGKRLVISPLRSKQQTN